MPLGVFLARSDATSTVSDTFFTLASKYLNAHKEAFFEPRPGTLALYEPFNDRVKRLVAEWWARIEDSRAFAENLSALKAYHRKLWPGDVTVVGLIAEGGQGMRTANNARFLAYPRLHFGRPFRAWKCCGRSTQGVARGLALPWAIICRAFSPAVCFQFRCDGLNQRLSVSISGSKAFVCLAWFAVSD